MWDGTFWTVLGLVMIAGVTLLFVRDALQDPNLGARVAVFVTITAGIAHADELWEPWLPLGLLATALALYVLGERFGSQASRRGRA